MAEVRAEVWRRSAVTNGDDPVTLDVDASLVTIHTEEKEGTGPTYKGGWGFHPLLVFADQTGEYLSGLLRPGNAGANAVVDHVVVLDEAIEQLPPEIAVGHHDGDDASLVAREVTIRSDSAGCSEGFLAACRARNVGFSVVARRNAQVEGAIFDAIGLEELWAPAIRQDSEPREGAAVIELTSLVELSHYPAGTRLIVRREPLHPGAQQSLFPSIDYRYWGHCTDRDGDPVALDCFMRAHAHVEEHIARLKDSRLCRFPFSSLEANRNWLFIVAASADLVRWFQLLCLDGHLASGRQVHGHRHRAVPVAYHQDGHTPHTLRHTAAMRLLHASTPVDIATIALWLGHETIETTNKYLHADMELKQRALDRTAPIDAKPGRYRPSDSLLAFLESL